MNLISKIQLKKKLEYHYKLFDKTRVSPDPVEFPHRYSLKNDIELSAFISSLFAYGNIKQIMNILEKIHSIIGSSPTDFILNYSSSKNYFENIFHRFYTKDDIDKLFLALKIIYINFDSLEYFFSNQNSLKKNISILSQEMTTICSRNNKISTGIKFMFPDPEKGSACKRMNLFLRWMVRKDEIDFGLWKSISTSQLIIPVDTHIAKIAKQLKLTTKKNISWNMAEEITNNLKKIDPIDPVKYDFALCHIGMRKLEF